VLSPILISFLIVVGIVDPAVSLNVGLRIYTARAVSATSIYLTLLEIEVPLGYPAVELTGTAIDLTYGVKILIP
jgi:hypothetical protein